MNVVTLATGAIQVNTYIAYGQDKKGVIIDPGGDAEKILDRVSKLGLEITHILLTHGHFDHIGAVARLKRELGAKVCIHEAEAETLTNNEASLGAFLGMYAEPVKPDILLTEGDIIRSDGLKFNVMHTPGHSPGSVCFLAPGVIFSGDTLFRQSIGRTDLPGGDFDTINKSLLRLAALEGDYVVYPGHMAATRLSIERESNPFLADLV